MQELQHSRKADVHALRPQFRLCRDQVPLIAHTESTPDTPTHRDALFARPPRTSPTANRPSRTPSQRTAPQRRAPSAAEDALPEMQQNALVVPVPLLPLDMSGLW